MDRKKIILIAVFINAGLLAVLFIAALTTQEKVVPEREIAEELPKPLFSEPIDLPAPTPLVQLPPKEEEVLVHKLPPLVPEVPLRLEPLPLEVAVKKGDSLDKIARAHRTTVDEIIKLNRLPSSFLKIGQILKIPAAVEKAVQKPVEKPTGPDYYTVKVGDNPWTIAGKHHMKVEELLRLNSLNEERARKLKPGDRLRIR